MEKFCFEKAGKFVGRGGTRSCEARFQCPHPTPPGTPLCYALECVNLSAQSCMLLYWQCQAEPIFVSSDGKAARAAGLFPVVNGSGFMPVMRQQTGASEHRQYSSIQAFTNTLPHTTAQNSDVPGKGEREGEKRAS